METYYIMAQSPLNVKAARALSKGLRAAREAAALTQQELASRTGIDQSTLAHYERGHRTPSAGNLAKLADALHVTVDQLLGSEPPATPDLPISLIVALRRLQKEDLQVVEMLARALGDRATRR
ncbi:MAG: helix-turn-helix transcriptional regulator [Phycisphaeraceae bacterium]